MKNLETKVKKKLVYISCPIYYANAKPHLGHVYSTLYADIIARFASQEGKKVFFITGCDQHGNKIFQTAQKDKKTPEEFVQTQTREFIKLWKKIGISYTHFVQTHSPIHENFVNKVFTQLKNNNHLYSGKYQGFYCFGCENFLSQETAKKLKTQPVCPDCQKQLVFLQESNFFLKVTDKYKNNLQTFFANQQKNQPNFHWLKQLQNLLDKPNLDFSVTRNRSSLNWGVVLDKQFNNQIAYVWIDALLSYWSCLKPQWQEKIWRDPDTEIIQVLGKEITKFHFIYWPLLCWMLNYRLPNHLVVHGWLLNQGEKMSKSKPITVVEPEFLLKKYGVAVLRVYLASLMNRQTDMRFDLKLLEVFYQTHIVNNLSNYFYRTLTMVQKYQVTFTSLLLKPQHQEERTTITETIQKLVDQYHSFFKQFAVADACQTVFTLLDYANHFIERKKPWVLAKQNPEYLVFVLYHCLLIGKIIGLMLQPIAPQLSLQILKDLGLDSDVNWSLKLNWSKPFVVKEITKMFK